MSLETLISLFFKILTGDLSEALLKPKEVPPNLPRRVRPSKSKNKIKAQQQVRTSAAVPAPTRKHTSVAPSISRPAVAEVRGDFRGVAALRRAVIAREVLGPPLSLRAPRY